MYRWEEVKLLVHIVAVGDCKDAVGVFGSQTYLIAKVFPEVRVNHISRLHIEVEVVWTVARIIVNPVVILMYGVCVVVCLVADIDLVASL